MKSTGLVFLASITLTGWSTSPAAAEDADADIGDATGLMLSAGYSVSAL